MTWNEYLAIGTTTLLFMIGLVASFLPVVPGNFIVWLGVIVHKIWMGDASVSWNIVLITGLITVVGQLADLYMGIWGARRFGASWKGAVGAVVGALVGLFLPPPLFWLIVGPIAGAVIGELIAGRTFREGGRAGIGSLIGGVIAFGVKFGLSLGVVAIFALSLVF
ncbi:MAG: DUF456 domain-containing protein [Opitutales bacterium]